MSDDFRGAEMYADMLSRRAGLSATAGLSCSVCADLCAPENETEQVPTLSSVHFLE